MKSTGFQYSARSTGFSLVELVVVVLVLGTIAAIAAPRFGNASSSYRLDAAIKKIEHDLNFALRSARATSSTVEILFDPENDRYTLVGVEDPKSKSDITIDLSATPYRVDLSDVRFKGTDPTVLTINGHGAIVNTGVVRIGLGPNARLIHLGGGSAAVQSGGLTWISVPPRDDAPSIGAITPSGFGDGEDSIGK